MELETFVAKVKVPWQGIDPPVRIKAAVIAFYNRHLG